jgi:putative FmdB family regulatory protein
MAWYEWECQDCKEVFDTMQSIKDDTKPKCPKCASEKVERLISKCSFYLNGTGWAADGYSKR